jgi:hypothetical protein
MLAATLDGRGLAAGAPVGTRPLCRGQLAGVRLATVTTRMCPISAEASHTFGAGQGVFA